MKVVVGLSGGVDSSVVAALMQQKGHEVIGVFMKNWEPLDEQALGDCPWEVDQADAEAVCKHLGIEFRSVNFEREYRERVVEYFLREYEAGRTPNPDVLCNRDIKFDAFLQFARNELGAEAIATGHYARVVEVNGQLKVGAGVDPLKDQSYFLYTLTHEQLSFAKFPLGEMTKVQVRELATKFGLPTAKKKDSQGICFIGHLDVKKFLKESLGTKQGLTYLLPAYKAEQSFEDRLKASFVVGSHEGVGFYTVGERAGGIVDNGLYRHLNDNTQVPPLYVAWRDPLGNKLWVCQDARDADLFANTLVVEDFCGDSDGLVGCDAQVRYHDHSPGKIISVEKRGDGLLLRLDPAPRAVAPGQSVVCYLDGVVVGGGVVKQVLPR